MSFLQNKPIPQQRIGTVFCSCGKAAKEMSPSVKGGKVTWTPRCGGCTGYTYSHGRKR